MDKTMKGIVYCAENNINGKCYIGRYVNNRKPRKGFHYKNNLV